MNALLLAALLAVTGQPTGYATGQMSPTSDLSNNRVKSQSGVNKALKDWAEMISTTSSGSVQLVNDLGGTPTAPTVVGPTHLSGSLPSSVDASNATVTATGATTARSAKDIASDMVSVKAFGAKCDGTTDDTAAVQAAINATCGTSSNGGTVAFPAGTCLLRGQITFPYTGTSPPTQKACRLIGTGANMQGTEQPTASAPNGGTVIDAQYVGTTGKFYTIGAGHLDVTGITFTDSAGGSTPWFYTTNTTLTIDNNAFFGTKTNTACDQDAIILGGTSAAAYRTTSADAAFQGYGTVISRNFFDHVRRAVYCRAYCNAVVIDSNNIFVNSGSNLTNGAAIDIDALGQPSSGAGNVITGNLIEVYGYPWAISINGAGNYILGNGAYDPGAGTLGGVRLRSGAGGNVVISSSTLTSKPDVQDEAGSGNQVLSSYLGTGQMNVGQAANASVGDVLHLYAGSTADFVFMALYPRSADRVTRGGYLGYPAAGYTSLYLKNEIGDLHLDTMSGKTIYADKSVRFGTSMVYASGTGFAFPTNGGTLTIDASVTTVYPVWAGSGVASFTMAAPTNGTIGQMITVSVSNQSGGALTTTWNGAFHMAPWTDPATGYERSITFLYDGNSRWRELSRTPADVPN